MKNEFFTKELITMYVHDVGYIDGYTNYPVSPLAGLNKIYMDGYNKGSSEYGTFTEPTTIIGYNTNEC